MPDPRNHGSDMDSHNFQFQWVGTRAVCFFVEQGRRDRLRA
ncbi:hypothetical protein ART_2038 [Arthrobacter sp. PAMC 25486]|nr:hypothetical protein ART_2038 [Arthrobacter sp. PAMC 25486]